VRVAPEKEATVKYIEVGEHRLRVSVWGRGRPLLLLMGIGGNIEMWRPFQEALSGFQTIAFDAPGTGFSSLPRLPLRMPALARMTAGLIEALGYESVDVLGVSYGGAIAQQLAKDRPERVRRLVLAATAYGIGSMPGDPLAMLILATPHRYYSPAYFQRVAPYLYGGAIGRNRGLVQSQSKVRAGHPPSLVGYLWQLAAITGWSSLPWLHRIPQPTLVINGDDDPIIRVANGRIIARLIPRARLHVIRGGGHLFLLDQATEAAAVVAGFLNEGES
jgi:poly(3-hydroxyoctanoate) depolymerase